MINLGIKFDIIWKVLKGELCVTSGGINLRSISVNSDCY